MKIGKEPNKKLKWIYQRESNSNEFLLGYKGSQFIEEITPKMIFAPYIPIYHKLTFWQKTKINIKYWFKKYILRIKPYEKENGLFKNTLKSEGSKSMFTDFTSDKKNC